MNKKVIIFIIILVLVGFGSYFIFNSFQGGAIPVREVTPQSLIVERTVSSSGSVHSQNEADLALAAVGIVQSLNIEKGEDVVTGQVLGNVSNYDSYQTSEASRQSLDIAKRDLDIYVENYETNKNAVGGEDEYELNVRRLNELVERAEASYQATLGSLSNTVLKAPFDGVIVDVYRVEGEVATAGVPIARIADLNDLLFEIELDQEDFGIVKLGQRVYITLDSYPDEQFRGVVEELPYYADPTSEDFTVKIGISQNGSENPVLLGMKGDVDIIIAETQDEVVAMPFDALFEDENGTYVWIDDNGLLAKYPVETGLEGDIYTEITTDLSVVKIVVPEADQEPEEGMKVRYAN